MYQYEQKWQDSGERNLVLDDGEDHGENALLLAVAVPTLLLEERNWCSARAIIAVVAVEAHWRFHCCWNTHWTSH